MDTKTITITFGDQAENHVGMEKIGQLASEGFTTGDLAEMKARFEADGIVVELIHLNTPDLPEAQVLIARGAADVILRKNGATSDDMFNEQIALEWDTKAKMRGKVVNKHARHNLCYGETAQEPDYEAGKGRIVAFDNIPHTAYVHQMIAHYCGEKAGDLVGEGNLYYDPKKCYISWHNDLERKKVVAVRLGATMPLYYQWFLKCEPIGNRIDLSVNHGDIYVMSEYATGNNGRKRNIPTLKHAAGNEKFLKIKEKK